MISAESVPRLFKRRSNSLSDAGVRKIVTSARFSSSSCSAWAWMAAAPWTSMFRSTSRPERSLPSTSDLSVP